MENVKSDAITHEEAAKNRLLIKEDIAKYELAKARTIAQVHQFDALIAECNLALEDINRREAGVDYPEPEEKAPAMGEPVGGDQESK